MNSARTTIIKKVRRDVDSERIRRRNVWWTVAVMMAVFALGSAGAYAYFREDPDLIALREIEEEIDALERKDDPQPDDAIVIEALRIVRQEKLAALSDAQRAVLDQRRDEQWQEREAEREARIDERLTAFFAKPAAERRAVIDKILEADETQRRAWERMAQREPAPGGDGPRRGPQGDAGNRPGRDGARGGERRGPRAPSTPEQRKQRERERLDRSTPQHRAQRTEFVRLVQERRKAQGLPPASIRQLYGVYRRLSAPQSGQSATTAVSPRS